MRRTLVVGDGVADIERGLRELIGEPPTWSSRRAGWGRPTTTARSRRSRTSPASSSSWTPPVLERITAGRTRWRCGTGSTGPGSTPGTASRRMCRVGRGRCSGWRAPRRDSSCRSTGRWWSSCPACRRSCAGCGPTPRGTPPWRRCSRGRAAAPVAHAHLRDRRVARRRSIHRSAGGDPPGVETSICARSFEIEIDIRADPGHEAPGGELAAQMRAELGEHVFATDERPLAEHRARPAAAAAVDRCAPRSRAPAAWWRRALTDIAGSSDAFAGGVVAYSNRAETRPARRPRGHARAARGGERRDRRGDGGRRPGEARRGRRGRRHRRRRTGWRDGGEAGRAGVPARVLAGRRGRAPHGDPRVARIGAGTGRDGGAPARSARISSHIPDP